LKPGKSIYHITGAAHFPSNIWNDDSAPFFLNRSYLKFNMQYHKKVPGVYQWVALFIAHSKKHWRPASWQKYG